MPVPGKDKAKDWQLEILMEKLRSKASQLKSLAETSKTVRMTLLVCYFQLGTYFLRLLYFYFIIRKRGML